MKPTFESVLKKFQDKGESLTTLFLNLPPIPIFDPGAIELSFRSREEAYSIFKELNKWRFDLYNKKLQELDVWIDYQQYR